VSPPDTAIFSLPVTTPSPSVALIVLRTWSVAAPVRSGSPLAVPVKVAFVDVIVLPSVVVQERGLAVRDRRGRERACHRFDALPVVEPVCDREPRRCEHHHAGRHEYQFAHRTLPGFAGLSYVDACRACCLRPRW